MKRRRGQLHRDLEIWSCGDRPTIDDGLSLRPEHSPSKAEQKFMIAV